MTNETRQSRGFAILSKNNPARMREIARRGGQTAHARGVAHEFTPEEARLAGRKGGTLATPEHLRFIGQKGGLASAQKRRERKETLTALELAQALNRGVTHEY